MNIIYFLLNKFFDEEKMNIILMIITSFIINLFQTNGISHITATIIESIQNNDKNKVIEFFKYFIIISVIYLALYNVYKHYQNKLLTKLRQWMRHQLTRILLLVNNENLSEINFTRLNSPINRISSVCFMVFNDIITYILPNITFLMIISIYFLYTNLIYGSLFIIGNILLFIYFLFIWKTILNDNEEYEKYVNANESYLMEILNNIDKIIYRGQINNEINIFNDKTNKSIDMAFKFYSNTNFHGIIMNIIIFFTLFACIGYLILLKFEKKIDVTIFITFFTILLLYRDKMITIIQQIPDFIEFLGRSDSVLKYFKNMEDYEEVYNKKYKNVDLKFETIKFEDVNFKYKMNNNYLFENLNIKFNTNNKIIGITGLSGNGKSTFVKLILKLYKCSGGKITIDDENIDDIDSEYIRTNITYVNQNSKLFDKKIIENILYGCNDIDKCNNHLTDIMQYQKIKELYKNIDIYNKQSGSLGENLSGGQRQIVNIISGLVNPSKILILDEPTNALDPNLKKELLGVIKDFKKHKKCIIIITHDRDVYPLFDETLHI
jgi:ATP-binding cassette subfamily B multidrug efflux pump